MHLFCEPQMFMSNFLLQARGKEKTFLTNQTLLWIRNVMGNIFFQNFKILNFVHIWQYGLWNEVFGLKHKNSNVSKNFHKT